MTLRSAVLERRIAGLALFAAALGLRLFYLWQIADAPAASVLFGDGEAYDLWARHIAGGDWLGHEAFYQAPLYPYFLAIIYFVTGPSLLAARIVQSVLGSLACVFVRWAGERWFGKQAGLAAGALLAIYPVAIYFDGMIQKTSLETFLLAVLLLCLAHWEQPHTRSGLVVWLLAGATLGLIGLVRENALILAPLILIRAVLPSAQRRPRFLSAAAFAVGLMVILLPIGFRNLAVGGSFHLTTYQLGTNLYIGNNPSASGMYAPLTEGGGSWRREREDAVRLAEQAEGHSLRPAEVSRYWTGRAWEFIRTQPGAWLRLMARKIALVFNRVEIGDHDSPELFTEASSLLRVLLRVAHFGVLLPLATLGAVLTWSSGRRSWMLLAILVALAASVAAFYVFGRYRFSLVPVLTLFAGAAVAEIGKLAREPSARLKVWLPAVVAMVLVAVASNWPLVRSEEIVANAYFNLGWKLEGEERADGDAAAARAAYERALSIRPDYPDAANNLGNLLAREGRIDEARQHFAAAVAIDPGHGNAQLNLGKALLAEGKLDEAVPHLEAAVRLHPKDPQAREPLAKALFGLQKPEAAVPHYQVLARLSATAASYNNLGSALAATGRLREAVDAYGAALRLDPVFVEAHSNLALTYLHLGNPNAAVSHLAEVVRLRPDSEPARKNLELARRAVRPDP